MAAADAQLYWMSAKVPNDQFLLFGFDGSPDRVDDAVAELRRRAESCGELRLRVAGVEGVVDERGGQLRGGGAVGHVGGLRPGRR